ncbi:hypothetical protein Tco_1051403 [Tanacetum coccineum]
MLTNSFAIRAGCCTCLNNTVADDDEVGGNEMTTAEVEQREAFIELKRKEVECREREIAATEYRAQQEDMKLYL